jgi:hypothetical protein
MSDPNIYNKDKYRLMLQNIAEAYDAAQQTDNGAY